MQTKEKYTLITGASRGLGKGLATECARQGRNLILISLPGEGVQKTANDFSEQYGVKAHWFETDLTDDENIFKIAEKVRNNYQVDMLINNAGIGGTNHFLHASTSYIDTIIQLNMKALVQLTHQLLPMLKKHKKAHILNIASLAAFGPMPFKTIYPASKAFVSSFSKGLNAELKGTGVSVSVAYPGGMITTPELEKRVANYNRLIKSTFLTPERAAQIIINGTFKNKTIIIPGLTVKLSRIMMKVLPEKTRLHLFSKNLKKELQINLS